MRFSAVIISSLVAFASAAPNAIVVRTSPNTDLIAQNLVFAAQASDCSILKCAEVLANVACIVAALATEEVSAGATTTAVVACVKEGLGEVGASLLRN
jgi:hypothetical protein